MPTLVEVRPRYFQGKQLIYRYLHLARIYYFSMNILLFLDIRSARRHAVSVLSFEVNQMLRIYFQLFLCAFPASADAIVGKTKTISFLCLDELRGET